MPGPVSVCSSPALGRDGPAATGGGFPGAVAAEWIKLWTVRSTWVCMGAAAVLVSAFAMIAGVTSPSRHGGGGANPLGMSAPATAATGVFFLGQFAALALATLMIASEYSTGSIVSSLQCVPVRARMLLAKCAVILPVLCCTGVLVGLLGTGVAAAAIGEHGPAVSDGDVAGQALAIGGYLAFAGVITVGIGAAVRSVAGTLTATWLLNLLIPVALQVTRVGWLATAGMYLPGGAGATLLHIGQASYGRPGAVVILAAWAIAAQSAGYVVLRRRDT